MANIDKNIRYSSQGPIPIVQPTSPKRDSGIDATLGLLQMYWGIDPKTRDKMWSWLDSDEDDSDTKTNSVTEFAPRDVDEARLNMAGYDTNLGRGLGDYGDLSWLKIANMQAPHDDDGYVTDETQENDFDRGLDDSLKRAGSDKV